MSSKDQNEASLQSYYSSNPIGNIQPDSFLLDTIPLALASFKEGNFLIVVDNLDRENEGDLIIAAQDCTKEKLAFMIRHTSYHIHYSIFTVSGVICAPMTAERCDFLKLPPMCADNQDTFSTAYTVSCDYKIGNSKCENALII